MHLRCVDLCERSWPRRWRRTPFRHCSPCNGSLVGIVFPLSSALFFLKLFVHLPTHFAVPESRSFTKRTVVAHTICLFGQARPRMHVNHIWPAFDAHTQTHLCMELFRFRSPRGSVHTLEFKTEFSKIKQPLRMTQAALAFFVSKTEAAQLRAKNGIAAFLIEN